MERMLLFHLNTLSRQVLRKRRALSRQEQETLKNNNNNEEEPFKSENKHLHLLKILSN